MECHGGLRNIEKTFAISEKNYRIILDNNNNKFANEQNIIALAYLFFKYNQNEKLPLKNSLSLSLVTSWLQEFNNYKQKCFNTQFKNYD